MTTTRAIPARFDDSASGWERALYAFLAEKDAGVARQVIFWSAGAPSYRWMDLITSRVLSGAPVTPYAHRVYNYVAMAMYDATVATWDSKYAYGRQHPSTVDPTITTVVPVPQSPSYPSEHAATAGAAAAPVGRGTLPTPFRGPHSPANWRERSRSPRAPRSGS